MKYHKTAVVLSLVLLSLSACKHPKTEDNNPVQTSNCDPNTVYFVNDILPLMQSSCAYSGCHDLSTHREGIILTDYSHIMSSGIVKAGNAAGSKMIKVITTGGSDDRMPPPPAAALSSTQIQKIKDWIDQGALNNECLSDNCDSTQVTFSGTVWPIMQSYCTGCHGGSSPAGGISIKNYGDVKSLADNGKLSGTIQWSPGFSPMPKGGNKLSDCKIALIKKWINDGAQNN